MRAHEITKEDKFYLVNPDTKAGTRIGPFGNHNDRFSLGAYHIDRNDRDVIRTIPFRSLSSYEGFQKTRPETVKKENNEKIVSLMRTIKAGEEIPLVVVRAVGDNKYEIIDGNHRAEAFRRLGNKSLKVRIIPRTHIVQK